ncbi:MAG TPA: type III-B CRISPR module-associated Cmr3 family protein, partial [Thermomicrobiales bacterium]|nr:type III-B CRISPR module-associated Cmr3 family protein [Thermomicrobiales bacterium]
MTTSDGGDEQAAGGEWVVELRPRDPILVRDARPFAADPGARATTLEWPLPTTVAGALRTHIGNALAFDWNAGGPDDARRIAVRGPFLLWRNDAGRAEVYFPAPRDAVPYRA